MDENEDKNKLEKDEATKINDMKKKLNRFLDDIDNEEIDNFSKGNDIFTITKPEKNVSRLDEKITKVNTNSIFNDNALNNSPDNIFNSKDNSKKDNIKNTIDLNHENKIKKPLNFKSSLLYNDDEDMFFVKKNNPIKLKETETIKEEDAKKNKQLIGNRFNYKRYC